MLFILGTAVTLGLGTLTLSALIAVSFPAPASALFIFPKLFGGAVLPFAAAVGIISGLLGFLVLLVRHHKSRLFTGLALAALLAGFSGASLAGTQLSRIMNTTYPEGFYTITAGISSLLAAGRPESSRQQPALRNVVFATTPGGEPLFCDIWTPPPGVHRSGKVVVYLHGGGWHWSDKGERAMFPFFRHLIANGHTVMDVAYRMTPQTDIFGMVGDVRRAICWIKQDTGRYGAQPNQVFLAGSSAGGHLAMLTALTAGHPRFVTGDTRTCDTTVRAVISFYGPSDLRDLYHHLVTLPYIRNSHFLCRAMNRLGDWAYRSVYSRENSCDTAAGVFRDLLGGELDEKPELYELASPVIHVSAAAPPTLLIHGAHDSVVPPEASRKVFRLLRQERIQCHYYEIPHAEHGFDTILADISPAAQGAYRLVEHFMSALK